MKLIEFTEILLRGVCPAITIAFVLSHIMFQGELFSKKSSLKDKLYLIFMFGMISSVGSLFAIYEKNVYIDTALLVVIVAGLKGGLLVGTGAGFIGALFRLLTFPPSGNFVFVTVIAGIMGGLFSLFHRKDTEPGKDGEHINMFEGFLVGALVGILQALIVPFILPGHIVRAIPLSIPFLVVNGFAVCMYLFIMKTLQAINEKQQAEELRTRAQLRMLQSQVNPHFLFNALNTIAAFSRKDPEKTRHLIQSLSEFLRITLKTSANSISIEEELENLDFYLEIEKARFGERIEFQNNIPDDLMKVKVPFLSIQPLIENSIKHGFYEDSRKLVIILTGEKRDGFINIHVEDNGKGIKEEKLKEILDMEKETEGIGLQNVIKRFRNMGANVIVKSEYNKGTSIEIKLKG